MTSRQLDEETIFHTARKIADAEGRQEYLDQICAGDQALRQRVEALLATHEQQSEFLKSKPPLAPTLDQPSFPEAAGQQIGRYKLLQQIGEGGFGVVYMAEQARPIRRKVALKLIKPGMDSKAVVTRFEAERQALAMMDHENIARVLDGGATDSGRPYFVMELVKGVPITEYCDQNNLSTDQRLKLFITVCQAVQHAHQKGIIHRDIKPSNVLVTLHDGKPVVKVIDFGVAKAINQQLTEKTLFTTYGQMIGTPQYMSPEQAEMSGLDVDTRSDIYSLGVLLYELLTGTTPLESERLRTAGYAEMQRLIREEEPPKPSTRLSTSAEKLTVIARHRSISPERLERQVRGDLDWIVMKALEKDRSRRYESATHLATDVNRFMTNDPIEARGPSTIYRLRKFATRNRTSIFVVTLLFAATLAGGIIAGLGWNKYSGLYDEKQQEVAKNESLLAEKERLISKLREQLLVRVIDLALIGRKINAEMDEAQQAGVPSEILESLKALAMLYQGEAAEAVALTSKILESNPASHSAWSVRWFALLYIGDYQGMSQCMERLDGLNPETDVDKFLFAQVRTHIDDSTSALLGELLQRHSNWGAVYALRGRATVTWSTEADSDDSILSGMKRGLRDFEHAELLVPDSPFVQTEHLRALSNAIEFAESRGLKKEYEEWRNMAEGLATKLRQISSRVTNVTNTLSFYDSVVGRTDKSRSVFDVERTQKTTAAWQVSASELFAKRNWNELESLFGTDDHPGVIICRAFEDMEQSTDAVDVKRIAKQAYENAVTETNFAYEIHVLAIDCLLLSGASDEASRAARELLLRRPTFSNRWYKYYLEYLANPTQAEEERILRKAGPFRESRTWAHYAIAMVALSRGDREKAIQYFTSVRETSLTDWWFPCWARAFLSRLEESRKWPSWIP